MKFGKRNQLFGLDIGSSSLKLAEVRKTGKGRRNGRVGKRRISRGHKHLRSG